MGLADRKKPLYGRCTRKVSILVLMDGARRLVNGLFAFYKPLGFNPCFDGWGSPTVVATATAYYAVHVSILVLMDGARRLVLSIPRGGLRMTRFNPCFDGWGSPTLPKIMDEFGGCGVSILVLMDGARRRIEFIS